ncbi:hypothetical protein BGX31_008027 [Mortierella sp. GBA43]|nr:hypothetical protein BGX31_008027 [Mortierella sp. GBA43]
MHASRRIYTITVHTTISETTSSPTNETVTAFEEYYNGQTYGSQLRELSWLGSGHQMDTEYKDALMNLPCLEELELYNWRVDNDLIYGILRGCSRTLRELNLFGLSGCNEDLFHIDDITRSQPSDVPAGMAPWSLPHLKSLKLMLADRQPVATIRLLRLCPALETIDIYILGQRHSISNFTSELRGYCQNLQAINLQMFPFRVHNDYNPDPEVEALLFKNSCGSKGLRRAMMRLSRRMDSLMRDALLFHADNLVTLQIECHQLERGHTPKAQQLAEIQNVACLLERCKNLKGFEISNLNFDHSCVAELLTSPWACKGLEHLVIISKPSTTITSERIPPKQLQLLEYERKRIRHEAWPRRLRHHEYRDDGQGWFLKPGLTRIEFLDALIDGNWKRSLFEHMYATSSIRKARYIRLKDTEFFSQEQQFNDIEAERKEMVEEEGFVVNFRVVHPKYGVLKQHGFAPFSTKKRSPR